MGMKICAMSSTSFRFQSNLQEWEQVRDWTKENDITWHALGNNIIGFDNKEHAVMFALRWL